MEIFTVQLANQNKTVLELRTIYSAIWIRMLEDDRKQSVFSYPKLKRNPAHFLARLNKISNEDVLRQSYQ